MFKKLNIAIFFIILTQVTFAEKKVTTWSAGTQYVGEVNVFGTVWNCNNGKCIIKGPYGSGLSMGVCKALVKKVGSLDYYSNSAGKTWSKTENQLKLKQCNGDKNTYIVNQDTNKKNNKTAKSNTRCNSKTARDRLNAFEAKYTAKLKQKNIKRTRDNMLLVNLVLRELTKMTKTNPSKVCQAIDEADKRLAQQK